MDLTFQHSLAQTQADHSIIRPVILNIVVTIPIFFPIVTQFNFDPIWFGVIVVMVGEMGGITQPVGVNVFVIKGIAPEVPLQVIYRGIIPFLIAIILLTILLVIFPQIALSCPI